MRRITITTLALGLATCVAAGGALAQNYGAQTYPYASTTPPAAGAYGNRGGAYYDYARVIRVDPVAGAHGRAYPVSNSQRCYTRTEGYAGNNGYYGNDGYGNGYYSGGYYGNDPYRNDGYYGGRGQGSNAGRNIATVIGGVVGAAIGSQIGGGDARYATSAIGSMVGGMAGRQIYESSHRNRQRVASVRVCDPVPADGRYYGTAGNGVTAYDVTYEYAGRRYTTRTRYNPGNRIRVRVDVRPE